MRGRGGRGLVVACLLSLAAVGPAAAEAPPIEDGAALRPFFAALARLERRRAAAPVRIMQIGDSHTANDAFSGRLRERLQARFGAAGRGWLPAGVPFAYFRPAGVTVAESGWRHVKPGPGAAGVRLGLDAVAAVPEAAGARMVLTSEAGFDRVAVEFAAGPDGAALALRIDDGNPTALATPTATATGTAIDTARAAPRPGPRRVERRLRRPAHRVELTAPRPAGQQVLGWAVERRGGGVIYENHGTIGATVGLLPKLDPAAVGFELRERRPALLLVAFGTNEGFDEGLDLAQYAARFEAAVADLAHRAGGAAVLVVGPPDGNRLPPACAGQPVAACGSHAEGCAWSEPRNLAAVRDIQRRAARRRGWAFWDWAAAMGGRCGIDRWLGREPPLAMADHVHLSRPGYAAAADMLFSALMHGYDGWRHGHLSGAGRR